MAGGGSTRGSTGKKRARIEIIPLIDVIFFLLATFVLFTLSLNKSNGLQVTLPNSETGEPRDPAGTATVTVTMDGTLAWDKDPVTAEEFLTRLKVFHLQHPEPDAPYLLNGETPTLNSAPRSYMSWTRRAWGDSCGFCLKPFPNRGVPPETAIIRHFIPHATSTMAGSSSNPKPERAQEEGPHRDHHSPDRCHLLSTRNLRLVHSFVE